MEDKDSLTYYAWLDYGIYVGIYVWNTDTLVGLKAIDNFEVAKQLKINVL